MKVRLNMELYFQTEFGFARQALITQRASEGEETRLNHHDGFVFEGIYDIFGTADFVQYSAEIATCSIKIINTGWRRIN